MRRMEWTEIKVDIAGVDMNISEIFENSIVNSLELLVACFN